MYTAPIVMDGEPIGFICGPGPMERVIDEPDGDPRWCFTCRTVRPFRFTVDREIELSYYGPTPAIRCAVCQTSDGDCFPGNYRTWED